MKTLHQHITERLILSKDKNKQYKLFPETKEELLEMIKIEIGNNGNKCSLNHINVREITDMRRLFYGSSFIGDISKWDVSNVKYMEAMFMDSEFNGDISKWDVSNVKDMSRMFANSEFTGENGDISNWDVSNVEDMMYMFDGSKFDCDISNWDVSNVETRKSFASNSPLAKNKLKYPRFKR